MLGCKPLHELLSVAEALVYSGTVEYTHQVVLVTAYKTMPGSLSGAGLYALPVFRQ